MDMSSAGDSLVTLTSELCAAGNGVRWQECDSSTDRSEWNPRIARFFDYWLSIAPPGCLPGRQHFDPLDISELMPRVWILDVMREPRMRFRYRLVGTREVRTLEREVTGRWLDEVHPHLKDVPDGFERFHHIAGTGRATYRKGRVTFVHHKDDRIVENCMVPLARDGFRVDMIMACSVLYRSDGKEN